MVEDLRDTLGQWEKKFSSWLFDAALPLWWEKGADHVNGGFHELMGLDGEPVIAPRRARVQGRQSYVYAAAGVLGWQGPWAEAGEHGLKFLKAHYRRPSGLFCTLASPEGKVLDSSEMLYDQAFALLASAVLSKQAPEREDFKTFAREILSAIETRRHPAGGFRETGDMPFLSNPHMHLFEASLTWYTVSEDEAWFKLASQIVRLGLTRFIDPDTLTLHEYFDENWGVFPGDKGRVLVPGHQFEWAWLLEWWSKVSGKMDAHQLARRLFEVGSSGTDKIRNVVVDEMDDTFEFTQPNGRLWNQTERLKAALILADAEGVTERDYYYGEAVLAAETLWKFLDTPVRGLWHDRMLADGSFAAEPAPASSFYHIMCAISCLRDALKV